MRKCDWTDYRQAMINNGYNDERAIESLVKKEFHLADIFSAQKEFQNKWENAGIEQALQRQNCYMTSGSKQDLALLKKNSERIAAQIRAGIKKD